MAPELRIALAGEDVLLLGARALYRPDARALLIADLHLGKGEAFRRAGIALPSGGTAHDLERLDALLQRHPSDTLWILGDLLHGPVPRAHWLAHWQRWRARHAALRIRVLRGNHDRMLDPTTLGIDTMETEAEDGPFLLRHDPVAHPRLHVVCGHVHPQAQLPGLRRRWPAFWLRPGISVLPAFSAFTAGITPSLRGGEQLVACVEGEAVALPAHDAPSGTAS
ncbi:ligase-associated DNA damage response endonuclease PdeM [Xanthomonas sp. XNM01]|uniref:ligase-associated DNA damage response endonuclease PdeM n=1 Tax=Xanthomonas sp. XNM01 TaxID=2769289 RepID=UPI00177C791F|nr:ligase-associated DNA damage response endonuclease PdeM [Xanthomonas sp. XNM01]MBD9369997.1 ligase-associated DNA damage response endonuclease PdeM [Xanthomonas sp. XNM01]